MLVAVEAVILRANAKLGSDSATHEAADYESLLLGRLDGFCAVHSADPLDGFGAGLAGQYGQHSQRGPGPTVPTKATDFYPLAGAGAIKYRRQPRDKLGWVCGYTEIGSLHMAMGPRRLPPAVEIQTVVRLLSPPIRIRGVKRAGHTQCAVRQHHHRTMPVDHQIRSAAAEATMPTT
jgi:hypothetical protein